METYVQILIASSFVMDGNWRQLRLSLDGEKPLWYIHHGMRRSDTEEQPMATRVSLWRITLGAEKPVPEGLTVCDSTYMMVIQRLNYKTGDQVSGCRG